MPIFAQAVPFLIASVAMTSSITTINTVIGTNDFKFTTRRETRKSSKKNEAPRVCTEHNFVGSSKYQNCQDVEYTVDILCATRRTCTYTEHYVSENGEECTVQGSFDPIAQISTDSARPDVCHLSFVPLTDSCLGVVLPGFGMKAEIHNNRNTGNHGIHNNENGNSGMLIRFSSTGGVKYYNEKDPRKTVPLHHHVIPSTRSLLFGVTCVEQGDYDPELCGWGSTKSTPEGSEFQGWSCDTSHGNNDHEGCYDKDGKFRKNAYFNHPLSSGIRYAFQTCFGLGGPNGRRCWSKAHYISNWVTNAMYPCKPKALIMDGTPMTWYVTRPLSSGKCGEPCDFGFHEWVKDPVHCPFIGDDKNYKDLSPNWCDCGHNKVDSCPGTNVDICATECDNIDDLWCKDDLDDDSRLCYNLITEKCYC